MTTMSNTMDANPGTRTLTHRWGWLLVLGIVQIIAGTIAFAIPIVASFAAVAIFGAVLLVTATFQLVHAFKIGVWPRSAWYGLSGVLSVVNGHADIRPVYVGIPAELILHVPPDVCVQSHITYSRVGLTVMPGCVIFPIWARRTRNSTVESLGPLWYPWRPGWGGWGYWGAEPDEEFVTHYTGHVLANLAGPNGKGMRCQFQLLRADEGMKGGGEGQCQLSSGQNIKADFPPS